MPRATIIVDVTHPEEVTASEDWLAKWTQPHLPLRESGVRLLRQHLGRGGPEEALAALPSSLKGDSESAQRGTHGH